MRVRRERRHVAMTVSVSNGRCGRNCVWCTRGDFDLASDGNGRTGLAHRILFWSFSENSLATVMTLLQRGFTRDALLVVTAGAGIKLFRDVRGDVAELVDLSDAAAARDHSDNGIEIRERTLDGSTRDIVLTTAAPPKRSQDRRSPRPPSGHSVADREENPRSSSRATVIGFGRHDLAGLRHLVAEHAHRAEMETQRSVDLVFLVNEVLSNARERGAGRGTLRIWSTGNHVVCEVTSRAASYRGPFAAPARLLRRVLRGVAVLFRSAWWRRRRAAGLGATHPGPPRQRTVDNGHRAGRATWDRPG